MRLTADQVHRIVERIESIDYGVVEVHVNGPGREIRLTVTQGETIGAPGADASRARARATDPLDSVADKD